MTGRDLFGVVIRVIGFCVAAAGFVQLVQVVLALSSGMPMGTGLVFVTPILAAVVGLALMRFADYVVGFAYGKA